MAKVSLDNRCRPVADIAVIGPKGEKTVSAIIDTGFDGFLSLPSDILDEIGLGAPGTRATAKATLANDETVPVEVCLGSARIDDEGDVGLFMIAPPNGDVLLGIQFLFAFKRRLIFDVINDTAELVPTA